MIVTHKGKIVFESYKLGRRADQPNPLASGTKSFSCAIAVAGIQDKLLTWDEPIAKTITEWRSDPQKSQITIRQLLSLTSGLPGGKIGQVPTYQDAIATPLAAAPGTTFQYGPIPYQVFGEVMRRKLATQGKTEDPLAYLTRKVLQPIGLHVAVWRRTKDGQPRLPAGASLTAREWLKYGLLLLNQGKWNGQTILDAKLLQDCYQGSRANPAYGLTVWLNSGSSLPGTKPGMKQDSLLPKDGIMALGAGKQGLYVIPSLDLVIVRQGVLNRSTLNEDKGFQHQRFLRLLLDR
jgi:CubicO group peptidase (beta-lactamase class C family)